MFFCSRKSRFLVVVASDPCTFSGVRRIIIIGCYLLWKFTRVFFTKRCHDWRWCREDQIRIYARTHLNAHTKNKWTFEHYATGRATTNDSRRGRLVIVVTTCTTTEQKRSVRGLRINVTVPPTDGPESAYVWHEEYSALRLPATLSHPGSSNHGRRRLSLSLDGIYRYFSHSYFTFATVAHFWIRSKGIAPPISQEKKIWNTYVICRKQNRAHGFHLSDLIARKN